MFFDTGFQDEKIQVLTLGLIAGYLGNIIMLIQMNP